MGYDRENRPNPTQLETKKGQPLFETAPSSNAGCRLASSLLHHHRIRRNEGCRSGSALAVDVGVAQVDTASIADFESDARCLVFEANDREEAAGQGIDVGAGKCDRNR